LKATAERKVAKLQKLCSVSEADDESVRSV